MSEPNHTIAQCRILHTRRITDRLAFDLSDSSGLSVRAWLLLFAALRIAGSDDEYVLVSAERER